MVKLYVLPSILVILRSYTVCFRTMANYFTWTLLHNYIETLPQNFGDAHFEFLKIMRGLVAPEPRWEMCIYFSESYMGFALASILVKETFNEDMKEEVSIV